MSDILTPNELDGLRVDANLLLGISEDEVDAGVTQISVWRKDPDPTFDQDTGLYSLTSTTIYAGASIIYPVVFRRSRQESMGEDEVRVRTYRVFVPHDAGDIHVDDYVTVTACDDPDFVNRTIQVIDVMYESEMALRRLDCVDIEHDDTALYERQ